MDETINEEHLLDGTIEEETMMEETIDEETMMEETVTWSNDDTAVHTVTSGKDLLHDELFDSSIFMSGTTFETTFNDAGSFDYFCLVHPWMTGIVHVS